MKKVITTMLCLLLVIPALPQTQVTHPWQGKRVAYFGDSLSDPLGRAGKVKWWKVLENWLGTTSYVYAVVGREWNDIPNQAQKLKQDHGDNFDAIVILMGTNDFNAGLPIGEWYTEKEEKVLAAGHSPRAIVTRKKRTPIMSDSTYRGRINIAISTVKSMFPTKQIVLITTMHRSYAKFGEDNIQPSEAYQNECGEYIDKYIESVKEASNIWSVPVIDLNATCGLYPMMPEFHQYFYDAKTDQLHPNDNGHQRMAATLYYQLMSIPCVFDVK